MVRPNVERERWLAVAGEAKGWARLRLVGDAEPARRRAESAARAKEGPLWSRIVFFFLTLLCVAAFVGLLHLAGAPWGLLTLIAAMALAEVLILRFGFLHTGVEEALWIGGLFVFIFDLPGPARDEGLLLFAAASAIGGWRLLNPLFMAGAVAFVLAYAGAKSGSEEVAGWLALGAGLSAALLLQRLWRRPWLEWTFALLALGMPMFAWIAFEWGGSDAITNLQLAGMLVAIVALLACGILVRTHPPLIGALLVAVPVGFEIGSRMPLRRDLKMILAGTVALALALTLDRWLRTPRRGIISIRTRDERGLDLLEMAAVAAVAPGSEPAREREGEFGGAGASGEY